MTKETFRLYYNVMNDQLGIAADGWEYICLCRFVPIVRIMSNKIWPDAGDPIAFVPHQIVEDFTDDWEEIGIF